MRNIKTSCTIIIYHYESIEFLKACVRKVRQYAHPEILQKIIITDQSTEDCYRKIESEFGKDEDIVIVKTAPLWSGYALDYVMRFCDIETEFVCGIEPDVFPIHKNWLYVSIKLIQENNFKFVGVIITETNGTESIYPPTKFFWISQCLRVGRTSGYKELAMEGGFTRFHSMAELKDEMTWGNDDWAKWAEGDYPARGSDDATVAHCWEDNHRENDKFTFATTHIMGIPNEESGYGRIIDDLVFHFGFHRTGVGVEKEMGERYANWKARINNGCDDNVIAEMLNFALLHPTGNNDRKVWDGKLKKAYSPSEKLNQRIEELKHE